MCYVKRQKTKIVSNPPTKPMTIVEGRSGAALPTPVACRRARRTCDGAF
jgi:hypothetical protein